MAALWAQLPVKSINKTAYESDSKLSQAQPIHSYNLLIAYNGYAMQVKAQDISYPNENSVLWNLEWMLEAALPSFL